MALPIFQSDNRIQSMMQTQWAGQINPVLANPITKGTVLNNVALVSGSNTINHLQSHPLNGYIIVGMHGAFAQIYDTPSPMPDLTLVLHASAPTVVSIYVY